MVLNASCNALLLHISMDHPPARAPLSARSLMVSSSSPWRGTDEPPIGWGAIPVGRGWASPPGTAAGAYWPSWTPAPLLMPWELPAACYKFCSTKYWNKYHIFLINKRTEHITVYRINGWMHQFQVLLLQRRRTRSLHQILSTILPHITWSSQIRWNRIAQQN